METVGRLRERFPQLQDPPSDDICYATQNRQLAVKQIAADSDLVIVVGSRNSSNSVRLVEVALEHGARAGYLVDYADEIDEAWLEGVDDGRRDLRRAACRRCWSRRAGVPRRARLRRRRRRSSRAEESLMFSLPQRAAPRPQGPRRVEATKVRHDAASSRRRLAALIRDAVPRTSAGAGLPALRSPAALLVAVSVAGPAPVRPARPGRRLVEVGRARRPRSSGSSAAVSGRGAPRAAAASGMSARSGRGRASGAR